MSEPLVGRVDEGYASGMASSARRRGNHTIEEWLAQPEELRLELIDGEFVQKAAPDIEHGSTQLELSVQLSPASSRRGGGWILGLEVDIALGEHGFRPDVSGWRRERLAGMPKGRPVRLRPDWICEVLSESNASNDTVRKMRHYHAAGVCHYWIVDPATRSLAVYRHAPEGFMNVLIAGSGERVRAEPFDAIEIDVGRLFDDEEEPAPAER